MKMTEYRVNKLFRSTKTLQLKNKGKRLRSRGEWMEKSLRHPRDNIERSKIYVTEAPQKEEKGIGIEDLFKEKKKLKTYQVRFRCQVKKSRKLEIQNRITSIKITPRHTIINLLET